jgi:hypothetical protein
MKGEAYEKSGESIHAPTQTCGQQVSALANPLAENTLVLASIDGAAVPTDPVVRLEFSADEASGFASCSFFGGSRRLLRPRCSARTRC